MKYSKNIIQIATILIFVILAITFSLYYQTRIREPFVLVISIIASVVTVLGIVKQLVDYVVEKKEYQNLRNDMDKGRLKSISYSNLENEKIALEYRVAFLERLVELIISDETFKKKLDQKTISRIQNEALELTERRNPEAKININIGGKNE